MTLVAAAAAPPVIILSRCDVSELMSPADYLQAVQAGFAAVHAGAAEVPLPWHIEGDGGGFHGKGASLRLDRLYVALKLNGNFPENPARRGLPTVQGAVLLFDGETGSPLAIIDSIEITLRRTAAATALAARYLARPESATLLVCGCGDQAPAQIDALRAVLPVERILAWDRDGQRAERLAGGRPDVRAVADVGEAARAADVIVTCTSATEPFLAADMVRPGTFIAAVGADAPHKCEIQPDLMRQVLVVADSVAQCAVMGDLHHALDASVMSIDSVHAELADLVGGTKRGRSNPEEVTLFDSTGTAVQDVASAVEIYRRASVAGSGLSIALGA